MKKVKVKLKAIGSPDSNAGNISTDGVPKKYNSNGGNIRVKLKKK